MRKYDTAKGAGALKRGCGEKFYRGKGAFAAKERAAENFAPVCHAGVGLSRPFVRPPVCCAGAGLPRRCRFVPHVRQSAFAGPFSRAGSRSRGGQEITLPSYMPFPSVIISSFRLRKGIYPSSFFASSTSSTEEETMYTSSNSFMTSILRKCARTPSKT